MAARTPCPPERLPPTRAGACLRARLPPRGSAALGLRTRRVGSRSSLACGRRRRQCRRVGRPSRRRSENALGLVDAGLSQRVDDRCAEIDTRPQRDRPERAEKLDVDRWVVEHRRALVRPKWGRRREGGAERSPPRRLAPLTADTLRSRVGASSRVVAVAGRARRRTADDQSGVADTTHRQRRADLTPAGGCVNPERPSASHACGQPLPIGLRPRLSHSPTF
jgi:hypothetical protein